METSIMSDISLFTSESVTEGHPDKVADQISDGILDAILKEDKNGRVACETMVTTGLVLVAGEISTSCYVDMPDIIRGTIENIGYISSDMGFDYKTCSVLTSIDKQSSDIAIGVNEGEGEHLEQGAGDQGLMFGFATNETKTLMPAPIFYSHKLAYALRELRKNRHPGSLRPDGKTQVTFAYENGKPQYIDAIVVSTQHSPKLSQKELIEMLREELVLPNIPGELLNEKTKFYFNPTGRFVLGGPQADCGITGRKIIVDTYGGMGRHGGGAFSGKDPSKVDRSASYMARYMAKNIVAAGFAEKVEVQLAYAIGVAAPVSFRVDTFGTHTVDPLKIEAAAREVFDCRPKAIIQTLDLLKPMYQKTAAYGHFGREDIEFSWEKTDKVDALKNAL